MDLQENQAIISPDFQYDNTTKCSKDATITGNNTLKSAEKCISKKLFAFKNNSSFNGRTIKEKKNNVLSNNKTPSFILGQKIKFKYASRRRAMRQKIEIDNDSMTPLDNCSIRATNNIQDLKINEGEINYEKQKCDNVDIIDKKQKCDNVDIIDKQKCDNVDIINKKKKCDEVDMSNKKQKCDEVDVSNKMQKCDDDDVSIKKQKCDNVEVITIKKQRLDESALAIEKLKIERDQILVKLGDTNIKEKKKISKSHVVLVDRLPGIMVSNERDWKQNGRTNDQRTYSKSNAGDKLDHFNGRIKKKFIYGNYNRYYGYRNPNKLETDPRLSLIPKDWLLNNEILDIGCNVGSFSMAILRECLPKRIVGLDIDKDLIRVAKKNALYFFNLTRNGRKALNGNMMGIDDDDDRIDVKKTGCAAITNGIVAKMSSRDIVNRVSFVACNYVPEDDNFIAVQKAEYDVILALSISKWLHLNFGDVGLKRAFKRMFLQLRPGGVLILEPQEWSSYRKKKKLSEEIYKNFQEIKFFPDDFEKFLLSDEVGFSNCQNLGVAKNSSKGFQRPLLAFLKKK